MMEIVNAAIALDITVKGYDDVKTSTFVEQPCQAGGLCDSN
jgi:hypothetical protein